MPSEAPAFTCTHVEAVNRKLRLALLTDGQMIPVLSWFLNGEDCDPFDAESCVCGPDDDGKWHCVDLSDFQEAKTQ